MRLDVIVATYNRAALLARLLDSLFKAPVPAGLEVSVTVVDNNSTDGTRDLVQRYSGELGERVRYLSERQQGRSAALNTGIARTKGDLIGILDDDEEIDVAWYRVIHSRFTGGGVDYISGPYLPRWEAPPPCWLPERYHGVIGWVVSTDTVQIFGKDCSGIPMGGNIVLRRPVVEHVGPYRTDLGRIGQKRLGSCEDHDYFERLKLAGAHGEYLPTLIIYHYVPVTRLTKAYFRRWCLWHGVSAAILDSVHPQPVVHLGGVPRYLFGDAGRSLFRLLAGQHARRRDEAFADELALWQLAGFIYGKLWQAVPTLARK